MWNFAGICATGHFSYSLDSSEYAPIGSPSFHEEDQKKKLLEWSVATSEARQKVNRIFNGCENYNKVIKCFKLKIKYHRYLRIRPKRRKYNFLKFLFLR